jgi:kynurenine formamidase
VAVTNLNDEYDDWIEETARVAKFGRHDRLGTANFIDAAARLRAAATIRTGECIPLSRPIIEGGDDTSIVTEVMHAEMAEFNGRALGFGGQPVNTAGDVVHISAHGTGNTHLDALNHFGRGGRWYSDFLVDDPDAHSIMHLTNHGLFTRGVLVDIPAVRGTDWVDPDMPVGGDDIDAALDATGTTFEPGDALLLYMGRDRWEEAGHQFDPFAGDPTPGAGSGAAHWVVEHQVSIVCWDFLDALVPTQPDFQLHLLIWAIGLLLLDNAHLGDAAARVRENGTATGAFVVAPPALPRATGALVQPLFIQ